MSDTAWYNDVAVLARRPDEFWPSRQQSDHERLNSLVRLVAYATLAVYLYRRNFKYLSFGLGAIAFLSLVHRFGGQAPRRGPALRVARPPAVRVSCGMAPGGRCAVAAAPACTRSTPDNPFGNVLLSELSTPGRPPACNYDAHSAEIQRNFNRGLVRNVYDIYDKENSQRQFMTMPVTTTTADTIAFARFAYGGQGRPTCKESPGRCRGSFP